MKKTKRVDQNSPLVDNEREREKDLPRCRLLLLLSSLNERRRRRRRGGEEEEKEEKKDIKFADDNDLVAHLLPFHHLADIVTSLRMSKNM